MSTDGYSHCDIMRKDTGKPKPLFFHCFYVFNTSTKKKKAPYYLKYFLCHTDNPELKDIPFAKTEMIFLSPDNQFQHMQSICQQKLTVA